MDLFWLVEWVDIALRSNIDVSLVFKLRIDGDVPDSTSSVGWWGDHMRSCGSGWVVWIVWYIAHLWDSYTLTLPEIGIVTRLVLCDPHIFKLPWIPLHQVMNQTMPHRASFPSIRYSTPPNLISSLKLMLFILSSLTLIMLFNLIGWFNLIMLLLLLLNLIINMHITTTLNTYIFKSKWIPISFFKGISIINLTRNTLIFISNLWESKSIQQILSFLC